jgi:hypothetical protein
MRLYSLEIVIFCSGFGDSDGIPTEQGRVVHVVAYLMDDHVFGHLLSLISTSGYGSKDKV